MMEVQLPNGVILEGVPEGTSKEDIRLKAIAAGLATEADFRISPDPIPDPNTVSGDPSYFERVSDITGGTISEIKTMADPERRLAGRAPGIYAVPASFARGVGGVLVETGKEIIPEEASFENVLPAFRPLLEPVVKLGKLLSETDLAQEAIDIAKNSYSDYQNWKNASEENAYVARELEDSVEVGLLFSPSTRVAPIKPDVGEVGSSFIAKKGRDIARAGRQQKIRAKQEAITEIITPLSGFGEGKTVTSGLRGKRQYIPTEDEKETVRVMSKIPELDPKGTMINTYNVLDDAITSKANRITTGISQVGNPNIDVDQLLSNIQAKFYRQLEEDEVFSIAQKKAKIDEMLTAFRKFAGKGTSLEVLEARKKLDSKLKTDEYDQNSEIAKASKAGRRAISEAVHTALQDALSTGGVRATLKKAMPGVKQTAWEPNVPLKELLREQHLLYRAKDVVDEKRQVEAVNAVGRQVQNLQRSGFNPPQGAIGQTVAAGMAYKAATSPAMPYVVGGGAAIGAMYGVGKLALSGATKRALGQLLQTTDKALKSPNTTLEMAAQLKADRLVIIDLLNQPTEEPED